MISTGFLMARDMPIFRTMHKVNPEFFETSMFKRVAGTLQAKYAVAYGSKEARCHDLQTEDSLNIKLGGDDTPLTRQPVKIRDSIN